MSFNVSGAYATRVLSPITVSYDQDGLFTTSHVLAPGSLLGRSGLRTGDDQDHDARIAAGETGNHDSPGITAVAPLPDLDTATVLGVGTISGRLLDEIATYPVVLVQNDAAQFLVFPDGPPDLLSADTGTLDTTIRFYDGSGFAVDGQIPCFARGTMILTDRGERAVETLSPGTLVMTADHGLQVLRWVGARRVDAMTLEHRPELRPIRIAAGALGDGQPRHDLMVSPQHRMMIRSLIAQEMFGTDEILISAKFLLAIDGIDMVCGEGAVTYYHMLFDRHEVVFSNGAPSESLYTGPETLKMLTPSQRAEIAAIFANLVPGADLPAMARPSPEGRQSCRLAEQHAKDCTSLID